MTFKNLVVVLVGIGLSFMLMGCEGVEWWVIVTPPPPDNHPPVAVISASPTAGYAKLFVELDAFGSYDLDGQIVSYEWDFGDGSIGRGVELSHLYEDDSDRDNDGFNEGYVVKLKITDDKGDWDETYILIIVHNPLPVPSFSFSPQVAQVGEWVTFDATASYDPAGIIIKPPNGARIVSYEWNFGDGTTDKGVIVGHRYSNYGIYWITLTVTDDDGGRQILSQPVRVNQPPIADFTWYDCSLLLADRLARSKPEGIVPIVCIVFDAKTSHDPDGWITKYEWDFGDGTTGSGKVTWHEFVPGAIYTIKITVTDNDGATDQKRRRIRF